ncbi:ABC transporter permease [Paenibacillus rubinfantis]|uniref:ABC transporter permease n=1 Tax=Paenibacillus rubinfantis TaxID=1720296 RepID=UPI001E494932|nr:ABC transporter permease [Paenibacillus rubinfantis]
MVNFWKYRDLFIELIKKDIKLKYRNSFLGVLWSMLNPLLMMIVLSIVFSSLFNRHIENFPVYVLSGRLIYQFFSESTSFAMDSIVINSQLIRKVYVPKYLFTISRICSSFITTLIAIVPLVLVMLVTKVQFYWTNFFVVVPLIILLILSMGVGLLLATINVFFRDMKHLYSIVLTVIMYLTPIFYPAEIIPEKYKVLVELNPLFNIVGMFRGILMDGNIPAFQSIFNSLIYSMIVMLLGFFIFYKKQDKFIFHI